MDFRTVPGQNAGELFSATESLLREAARDADVDWELSIITERLPVDTPPDDPFVKLFIEVVTEMRGHEPAVCGTAYCTDASVLAPALSVPMVIFGPGEAACAHLTDEWVSVDSLYRSAGIYAALAASVLG
jgi:succinyl-diaminopimelate desuccinylase